MKLFKQRTEKQLNQQQQDMAGKIATGILNGQRKIADQLNRQTAGLSKKAWLWLLVGFCLTFGSYCTCLLVQAFK
jgi:hypothetical protein